MWKVVGAHTTERSVWESGKVKRVSKEKKIGGRQCGLALALKVVFLVVVILSATIVQNEIGNHWA